MGCMGGGQSADVWLALSAKADLPLLSTYNALLLLFTSLCYTRNCDASYHVHRMSSENYETHGR